ncbi:MAG: ShlB/FhaC/HecB family hemolysin secretion/activation protein [Verrucomicrobiota bacterium]
MSWKPEASLPVVASLLIVVFGWGPSGYLWAQGQGDIVEKVQDQREASLPQADPGGTMNVPDVPELVETDETPLGIELLAIRLIAHQDRTDLEATFSVEAPVMVDQDLLPPEGLESMLIEQFIGESLSLAELEKVTQSIIEAYREGDYPLVDVYLPEQNLSNGKLQIVVREAVLGEVRVEGAEHSDPDYLFNQIRIAPGERINSQILERDVDWINSNPSRRVDLIYERGEDDGTSDIILNTADLAPFSSYLSFGNTGIESTGLNEWAAGFNLFNLFGTEHSAGYSFSGDSELDNLNAHTLIYELPLPWRHRLQLIGAYVTSESEADSGVLPLDVDGESIQASADYKILLPKLANRHRQNLTIGLDYKSTNTDILFGGESFFDSVSEVFQVRAGYDIAIGDQFGYTRVDLGAVFSPGDVLNSNSDEDFAAIREGSSSDYWYLTGEVERYFILPQDWGLKFVTEGQLTDDRLISTEQLLAGGYRSIRGVDENLIRGDSGVLLSAELIAPGFSVFKINEVAKDSLNLFLFTDSAWLYSTGNTEGEEDQSLLTSGMGLNYRFGDHSRLRASYGWVLDESGIEDSSAGKWHLGLTITY